MENFEHKIETQLFLPEEWYYDDNVVSDIYQKISNKELPEDSIRYLYDEVQTLLNEILSIDANSRTTTEHEKAIALNNIARKLFNHFPHPGSEPQEYIDVIDLGDTAH